MIEAVAIVGLIGLNAFQLWYWSRETHRLIDKLMSRNYPEYVSSVSYLKPKPSPATEPTPDHDSIQQEEVLRELNGMLGN